MAISEAALRLLPSGIKGEIERIAARRGKKYSGISEIRLRSFGRSEFTVDGEKIELYHTVSTSELSALVEGIAQGGLFRHRESLREGYITLGSGIRVGVLGEARYDGGELVGLSEITSLCFRIPTGSSEVGGKLYDAFLTAKRGMLIYSPPGVGKTAALRSLAHSLGKRAGESVAVIDERREFSPSEFTAERVDVLRGYKRSLGIEIALRCASPTVIIVDEIGSREDARAIMLAAHSGVRLIATAHADCIEGLFRRAPLGGLITGDIFDLYAGIDLSDDGRRTVSLGGSWDKIRGDRPNNFSNGTDKRGAYKESTV